MILDDLCSGGASRFEVRDRLAERLLRPLHPEEAKESDELAWAIENEKNMLRMGMITPEEATLVGVT